MQEPNIRIAIIEPDAAQEPLELPTGCNAEVVLRLDLTPEEVQRLHDSRVQVIVIDSRQTYPAHIGQALRLLRFVQPRIPVVVVTDPGNDAAAEICLATGAIAHIGRGLTPLGLLRAINAAGRGTRSLGETGQRAIRKLRPGG